MGQGFIIAAPHSGSGKTTITLGLLRALKRMDTEVQPFKAGPDFIDPAFHKIASGVECFNLDPWAMRPDYLHSLASSGTGVTVFEAMMGLFDGAADGSGSAADLAFMLKLPIVLVVDASHQSHSIAALVSGFVNFRSDIRVAGVILNRVGSARHEIMLREALAAISVPVLGVVLRNEELTLPSRHLGLVQAVEHEQLEAFLNGAADLVKSGLDIDTLLALKVGSKPISNANGLMPIGQRIAVAHDTAFSFCYPHILKSWRDNGAEVLPFSPLANEGPDDDCDAVYLPGGYPELHGGQLSQNRKFLHGLRAAAAKNTMIYGECGGFMVLGEEIIDAKGDRHEMANLLPLVTSFEKRKLHLGYRVATSQSELPFVSRGETVTAHEFHYSMLINQGEGDALFSIADARGEDLGTCGLRRGNVAGSYLHVIDRQ